MSSCSDRLDDRREVGVRPPVAPGPPWKSVSPVKTTPRSRAWKQQAPGAWPGVCSTRSSTSPTWTTSPSARSRVGRQVGVALVPEHPVVRVERDLRAGWAASSSGTTVTWSSCAWVSRTWVRRRSPTSSRIGPASCGASMTTHLSSSPTTQTLFSTSHVPPSRLKVPAVVVWSTRTPPGDGLTRSCGQGHSSTTDRSTSPACILSNAASMSPRPMRSVTKASRSKRPCL